MRRILAAVVLLAGYANCVANDAGAPGGAPDPDFELRFSRGACFGECPIYEIRVNKGMVRYEGREYVKMVGHRSAVFPPDRLPRLIATLEKIDRIRPDPSGRICGGNIDAPKIHIKWSLRGRWHEVDHLQANPCLDEVLNPLEDEIDAIVESVRWVGTREEQYAAENRRRNRRNIVTFGPSEVQSVHDNIDVNAVTERLRDTSPYLPCAMSLDIEERITGQLVFYVLIPGDGRGARIKLGSSPINDKSAADCIIQHIDRSNFPAPRDRRPGAFKYKLGVDIVPAP